MTKRPTPFRVTWLVLCDHCGSYFTIGGKRCGNCHNDAVYLTGQDAQEAYNVLQTVRLLSGLGYTTKETVVYLALEHRRELDSK